MDLFYHSLHGDRKQRLHFHRFMLRVHEELVALQGTATRWKSPTASRRKPTFSVSMSFVSDITDAMLLGGLMKALFARGITLSGYLEHPAR